jgi:peptidoglycan/LPS O-acetylase OafA/YrhL
LKEYRFEIDGLRAIAVMAVIFCHARIPHFEGGYLGVDIFFVISGYLIAGILIKDFEKSGTINFMAFYNRRIRRIMPMLVITMLFSVIYSIFRFNDQDNREVITSAIYSLLFSSNIYFAQLSTAYSADSTLLKPLLHTWSLAIEEQFYLLLPLILLIFHKRITFAFSVLAVLSLIYSTFNIETQNSKIYYSTLARLFELSLGVLIAYFFKNKPFNLDKKYSTCFSIIGLILIFLSIIYFDEKTLHPGPVTIFPILGTALVLLFTKKESLISKLLSISLFRQIGLISYSAYLLHYPVFAICRYELFDFRIRHKLALIIGILILSKITHKYIEMPARNIKVISNKYFYRGFIAFICFLLAICFYGYNYPPSKQKQLNGSIKKILDTQKYLDDYYKNYEFKQSYKFINNEKPVLLVVGNSHAEDLYFTLLKTKYKNIYNIQLAAPEVKKVDSNFQINYFINYLSTENTVFPIHLSNTDKIDYGDNLTQQFHHSSIVMLATKWTGQDEYQKLEQLIEILINKGKKVIVVGNAPQSRAFTEFGYNRLDYFIRKKYRMPSKKELDEIENNFFKDYSKMSVNLYLLEICNKFSSSDVQFIDRVDYYYDVDSTKLTLWSYEYNDKLLSDYAHTTSVGKKVHAQRINQKNWLKAPSANRGLELE